LSSWWTKIVTGMLLFAFIGLQQAMLGFARRSRAGKPGVLKPGVLKS
jgi:galactofuranose transport system permease protein